MNLQKNKKNNFLSFILNHTQNTQLEHLKTTLKKGYKFKTTNKNHK